jgi:hypothetical protein
MVVKQGLSQSVAAKQSAVGSLVENYIVQSSMRFQPLSRDELERAILISEKVFRTRLTDQEKKKFRDNVQGWWR